MKHHRTKNSIHIKQDRLKWFILILILFILCYAAYSLILNKNTQELANDNINNTNQVIEQNIKPNKYSYIDYKLNVLDQSPNKKVVIDLINVPTNAWIAIYEDIRGEPGNILGAARFRPEHNFGYVPLLRATTHQSTYYAIIHIDDGDIEFNFEKDVQLINEDGTKIIAEFNTTAY